MRDDDWNNIEGIYAWEKWVESMKCPHDGEQLTYWEGTIEQDEQGNDLDGYWFTCPKCDYESEVTML